MSGLELADILLGAFPLIISGLEHWRDVAKVGGFWWRVRNGNKPIQLSVRPRSDLSLSSQALMSTSSSLSASAIRKKPAFTLPVRATPTLDPNSSVYSSIKLCQLLGNEQNCERAGIIGHNNETYHLHPVKSTTRTRPEDSRALTLGFMPSDDYAEHLSRRQRYSIALQLASSVAQLQFTPWLRTGLTKADAYFLPCTDDNSDIPHYEPFIRQGFSHQQSGTVNAQAADCNFTSLDILSEFCFGGRLEDHPLRKKHTSGTGDVKQAFDLLAAMKWSQRVSDEGWDEFASAVKWCFFTSARNANGSWRSKIIKNVIRPLEKCQEHLKAAVTT